MSLQQRFIVYTPWGAKLGPIPFPLSGRIRRSENEDSTLSLDYSEELARAAWLRGGVELGYEQYVDGDWREPDHVGRFVAPKLGWDRRAEGQVKAYMFHGMLWHLQGGRIIKPDIRDVRQGAVKPKRSFVDKSPGNIVKTLIDDLHDDDDLSDPLLMWAPDLGMSFSGPLDSNDVAWPTTITRSWDWGERLDVVLEDLVSAGLVDWSFTGRTLNLYIPSVPVGPTGVDRTVDPGSVIITDKVVTKAPEQGDFDALGNVALILAGDGGMGRKEKTDGDVPYGTRYLAVSASGVDPEDTAEVEAAAHLALKVGKGYRESISAEFSTDTPDVPIPTVDYDVGDLIRRQRGVDGTTVGDTTIRVNELRVMGWSLGFDADSAEGYVILNDKRAVAEAMVARGVSRLRAGASGTRLPDVPPPDPRVPDTAALEAVPTVPTITRTTETDRAQTLQGVVTLAYTWASEGPAVDSADALFYKDWLVQSKRPARKWKNEATVPADDTTTPLRLDGFDRNEAVDIRYAPVSHNNVRGAWSTVNSGAFPTDTKPGQGPTLIIDPAHATADLRTKRITDAGGSFTFTLESGEYVATFAASEVLDYAMSGTGQGTAGRFAVAEGETFYVKAEGKRVGGTAASLRLQVRWWDRTNTLLSTTNVVTTVLTTSYAVVAGTTTAPAGAAFAALRVTTTSLSGSPTVRMRRPALDRRASTVRLEEASVITDRIADLAVINGKVADDANTSRTTHATDNLTSKHTSTAALFQAAAGSSGWKGGTSGLYFYDGAGLAFEATSAGVFIRGSLEAGGILVEDDVIDFGGAHSIAYTGSDLIFTAASGFVFDGAATFNDTVNINAGLTADQILSDGEIQAMGQVGFNGNATSAKVVVNAAAITTGQTTTLCNQLRALLITFGLAT